MKSLRAACLVFACLAQCGIGRGDEVEWRPVASQQRPAESAPTAGTRQVQLIPEYLPPTDSSASSPHSAPGPRIFKQTKPATEGPTIDWRRPDSGPNVSFLAETAEPPLAQPLAEQIRTYTLVADGNASPEAKSMDAGRQFYLRGEFLLWWMKGMTAPPLVTTATPPNLGFLNGPTTQILYGNGVIGGQFMLGARLTAGAWLNECRTCGIDSSLFFLGPRVDVFHADTGQFPVLTRPIFAPNPGLGEAGQIVSFPPGFTLNGQPLPDAAGSIDVTSRTFLWGADAHAWKNLCSGGCCSGGYRVDLFGGFRYLDLGESLRVHENIVIGNNNQLQPPLPPGTQATVDDFFGTHNSFYGFPIGLEGEWHRGRWVAMLRSSIALGLNHEILLIDGRQTVTPPGGATTVFVGGLLALPGANMGHFERDVLSVVPEVTGNLGYQITPRWRAFVGYNFLYWSNVIRPGDQVDRVVDVTRVPNFVPPGVFQPVNPPRPTVLFNRNDFWTMGLNLGTEFRW